MDGLWKVNTLRPAFEIGCPATCQIREVVSWFEKPFLTSFSDGDPVTQGGHWIFYNRQPCAKGQPHRTVKGGGIFLQENQGEQFAR